MYEKRDKSNLPQKITSRECVLRGPKMLKIDYSGGWGGRGGPMSLAIWPTIFGLLGHCPTGQKFQNDHCTCIKFFTKTIQIIKKKTLHTSIISESIKYLVKKYYREVIRMLSKILLYTIGGK